MFTVASERSEAVRSFSRVAVRGAMAMSLLLVSVGVVGCNKNHCSVGKKGAQQCSGYTDGGDLYYLEYNEDEGWFYGTLWCSDGRTFSCEGDRGATGQGDDVVCVSYGPSPGVPGYEVPQDRVSCD